MDKLTMIAGLLFLSEIKEYQDSAIMLLNGDLTLDVAKKTPNLSKQVYELENLLKTETIDEETNQKVMEFVGKYLFEMA
ncbi:hypothetical protein ACVBAX_13455 [Robertmurraya sp. GLU-23]